VASDKKAGKKRGPKGGVKHTPGRGHTSKSGSRKRKRFQKKAARKRAAKVHELRRKWDEWDSLPPEAQKLRPDKKPTLPRPNDEGQATR
jgi:hypothetical protein